LFDHILIPHHRPVVQLDLSHLSLLLGQLLLMIIKLFGGLLKFLLEFGQLLGFRCEFSCGLNVLGLDGSYFGLEICEVL
jgi:hypothetical protein